MLHAAAPEASYSGRTSAIIAASQSSLRMVSGAINSAMSCTCRAAQRVRNRVVLAASFRPPAATRERESKALGFRAPFGRGRRDGLQDASCVSVHFGCILDFRLTLGFLLLGSLGIR